MPKSSPEILNKGVPEAMDFSEIFVFIILSSKLLITPSFANQLLPFDAPKPAKKTLWPNATLLKSTKPTVAKLFLSTFIKAKLFFASLFIIL